MITISDYEISQTQQKRLKCEHYNEDFAKTCTKCTQLAGVLTCMAGVVICKYVINCDIVAADTHVFGSRLFSFFYRNFFVKLFLYNV